MLRRTVTQANRALLQLRIWRNVELDPSGCWLWTGRKNKGYGTLTLRIKGRHCRLYAHRVAYEAFRVTIPEGKVIAHSYRCVSPACCNPWHLRATSQSSNNKDIRKAATWRVQELPERALQAPRIRKVLEPEEVL